MSNDIFWLGIVIIYLILRLLRINLYYELKKLFGREGFNNNTGAIVGEKNVFMYWVGNTPHLIELLRDLVYKHSNEGQAYKVHLINHGNLNQYVKDYDLPSCFKELIPAHQADFVRVYCVAKYGGIWLDSDTLVMDDMARLFNLLEEYDGFFVTEWGWICNGIFGSKPQTQFMNEWLEYAIRLLKDKNCKDIEWIELGGKYLTKSRDENKLTGYKILEGDKTIYPIGPNESIKEYIDKPYENHTIIEREFQPVVELVSPVYNKINEMVKSKDEIHNLNIPLNYFINKSLGKYCQL